MEISDEHLRAFFGKSADYYRHKWHEWQQGRRISFSVAAFFAGLFWFIYRRMYGLAALIFGLLVVEAELEQWLLPLLSPAYAQESQGRAVVVGLTLGTVLSATGNWLYLRHARRKITRILRTETSEEAVLRQLRRQGGTSWTFFLVAGALTAGLLWLLNRYPQYFQ